MGEAKRRKQFQAQADRLCTDDLHGIIDLQWLSPVSTINAARIRELTGDDAIPLLNTTKIVLQAFRAVVGPRIFHVGFCLGDKTGFSAIGIAVIDRLMLEVPGAPLYVVPVVHKDIAWDIVLRHLRNFTGKILLFAFPNSDTYDAGTAEMHYSNAIRLLDLEGKQTKRLTAAQRRKIQEQAAEVLNRPPPKMYAAPGELQEDIPWIFRVVTPVGKVIRAAIWNGRRDYAHEIPTDIVRWVGGEKIAIAQVDRPVGINLRSSLKLTHFLAKDFDGVIHWARDTETFQSILKSFIRLDLDSVSPPELPENWNPKVMILAASNTTDGDD